MNAYDKNSPRSVRYILRMDTVFLVKDNKNGKEAL
jgi:hypothetical protein